MQFPIKNIVCSATLSAQAGSAKQTFMRLQMVCLKWMVMTCLLTVTTLSQAATPCRILVMGDSLSAAYGLPVEKGWVALMEQRLNQKFPHCSVINASVSGETTAGGKSRLPLLLEQHLPTLMILELGANDGLRGLPIGTMIDNLNFMINKARNAGAQTILVGMQIPPNYGPSYTGRFKQAFPEVAKKQGLPLVPFMLDGFAQDPAAFQEDRIHPNAEAQPKILDTIWKTLAPQLSH